MSYFGLLGDLVHHPVSLDKQIFSHFKFPREYLCDSEKDELLQKLSQENLHWVRLRIFTYVYSDLFQMYSQSDFQLLSHIYFLSLFFFTQIRECQTGSSQYKKALGGNCANCPAYDMTQFHLSNVSSEDSREINDIGFREQ